MSHNRIEDSLLLDYYGELLTNHQKEILDEYFNEDLSMNEIADNYGISKAAVQDLIKRSLVQMYEYEKKLKLVSRARSFDILLNDMKNEKNEILDKYIKKLEKIK